MRILGLIAVAGIVTACVEEPPPRSVQEFVDNAILLEAAMVRCSANRVETRYEAECVNAREAIKIIAAREEKERRAEMEALSEKKRRALRRTLDAAAEARKRAAEQRRLQEEAAYLAQFGELPPSAEDGESETRSGNAPEAVLPSPGQAAESSGAGDDAGNGAAAGEPAEEADDAAPASDLSAIREELRNRQQETP